VRILIVGGGIGGVTAALCLALDGHDIDVFEQGETYTEIGAGIQLSPNCTRVLHHLGLENALRTAGFLPEGTEFRHWKSGKVITTSSLGETVRAKFGFPYYHIHRGDFIHLLVKEAEKKANIRLHTDSKVDGFIEASSSIQISVNGVKYEGDFLIGADGIHSVIRSTLWDDETPSFTGNVAWRALVPAAELPTGMVRPMSTAWWGPRRHFVHYYIKGGEVVNCVCVVEKDGWEIESWTEPGDYDELKADFRGWNEEIQTLIDHADQNSLYKWALHDRAPMKKWGKGRTTLLGDACHPTLPFMAQGAAMSIEDGAVLAACLRRTQEVPVALKNYEDLRRDRTAIIQNGSRRNASLFHLSGLKALARNFAVRRTTESTIERLFGYDALEAAE
ncbi:uncharacterized protein METZ01_LOCUS136724, partial [marine metagenome]